MTATISEALEILKQADQEEITGEIDIINCEIKELQEQIAARKRTIGTIRKLAGIKPGKNGCPKSKSVDSDPEDSGHVAPSGRCAAIMQLLEAKGPLRCSDIARHFQVADASINPVLRKHEGHHFTQQDDRRWALTGNPLV